MSAPQFGSLINIILPDGPEPEVGMGATVCYYSDRDAGTIIGVTRFKSGPRKGQLRSVTWQRDRARRTDGLGMTDAQAYEYEPDPEGMTRTFYQRKEGWHDGVSRIVFGRRDQFYDYTR